MTKRKIIVQLKLLTLFLGIITLVLLGRTQEVSAAEDTVVRVGVFEMSGFQTFDELDNLCGYNSEYLDRIASYTGWKYEYVKIPGFNEGLELLKQKKIDLLAPAQVTPERMEEFDYSAYSLGTEYYALVTLKGMTKYSYEDFDGFNGMKIAVVKNYLMTDEFVKYMHENNFTAELQYYDTPDEAVKALDRGRVNGAIINLMMLENKDKVLGKFSPVPFYYLTWKGNDEMREALNTALRNIKIADPAMENTLTERYFPFYSRQYFTAEDREFIDSMDTIRVGYASDSQPLSFTNEKTGEFDGITRHIFDRIQKISGLKFEYVALPKGTVTNEFLQDHGILLVSSAEYNNVNLNTDGLRVSNPYLYSKRVIVSNKKLAFEKGGNYKTALASGSKALKRSLIAEYPNLKIFDYKSIKACFDAVNRGDADILLMNQYVAENMMARPQYDGLSVIPVGGLDDNLCLSFADPYTDATAEEQRERTELINVLNKAISQISQDEISTIIVDQIMKYKYTYTFMDFCYRYRYTLMIVAIAVTGAFVSVIYIAMLKKKNILLRQEEEQKILLQQKRYQLIMDKSEEIIYEISLRGDSCLVSDRMRDKFGWSFPERVDNPTVDTLMNIWRVHPDDRETLRESLISMIDENESSESLIRMRQSEGGYIWCKVARFPLLDNDNILVSIVGKIADIDSEVREKEKLQMESRTDGLTKLLNKRTFSEEVDRYLTQNTSVKTGIIFVDMDHFKDVNDTLGHIAGDRAIRDAAKKLQVIFANVDMVARFGGDEFCIFVKDIPRDTLEDKLGWAVDKLKETYKDGGHIVSITASIGAIYCNAEGIDYRTLLEMADHALYEAKEHGRNQYILKQKE